MHALREALDVDEQAIHFPVLEAAQFTNEDVLAVTGLNATQLHNWVSRGWVHLTGADRPGKGRRRLFTGRDVIALELAQALQPFSLVAVARRILDQTAWVRVRASELLSGKGFSDLTSCLGVVPVSGDWLYVRKPEDVPAGTYAHLLIEFDKLIIGTLERLLMVVSGDTVPRKDIPTPPTKEEAEREYLRQMGHLVTADNGSEVYAGLTPEESEEYKRLFDSNWAARLGESPRLSGVDRDRYRKAADERMAASACRAKIMGGDFP